MSVVVPAVGACHNHHPVLPVLSFGHGQRCDREGQADAQQDQGLGKHLCNALQSSTKSTGRRGKTLMNGKTDSCSRVVL